MLRVLAIALSVALALGCSPPSSPSSSPPPTSQSPAKSPKRPLRPLASGDSNIARADYIGPNACGECHAEQFASWTLSLHRVMNASVVDPKAVIGDFAGAVLRYRGGEARFERDATGFMMTVRDRERSRRYRVTRTIGRRSLQEYVGIEERPRARASDAATRPEGPRVTDPSAAISGPQGEEQSEEVRLPFGWWPRFGGWAAQPDFDPWLAENSFDAYAHVKEPWAERCPWCHSTYAFAQRIARASGPRLVGHGFEQFYESAPGSDRLIVDQQVTTGISCESCHLGGRAHADGAAIDFLPRGAVPRADAPAWPQTFAEQREDPRVVNRVCAQCHSGPSPRLSDGTALRNSSEALDLQASACRAKCIDCHDPHRGGFDEARAVAACVSCHAAYAKSAHAGRGHAAPAPGQPARATCLDCHMPRMVMGIDRYVRTHRISSPTNPVLLAEAAPNACNLCHLDRTIAWTLTELHDGWDARLAVRNDAYGDENVGDVWLASASPAIRLIAMQAYARSPLGKYALAQIEKSLADPLAYVRAWTKFAVDEIKARGEKPR